MVEHVLRAADPLDAASTTLVVGHGADDVRAALAHRPRLSFVVQESQRGTGDALRQTASTLAGQSGTLLLLYGDVPLLKPHTLELLVNRREADNVPAIVLTATVTHPHGYGRIVRDESGNIVRIVEERDASAGERAISEINSGIYAFAIEPLFPALGRLASANAQGEYYLTDIVSTYRQQGQPVLTLHLGDAAEVLGINTRVDLAALDAVLRRRKNESLMLDGVTLEDPASTFIDADVVVGADTTLGPAVQLQGRTRVGARCRLHAGVRLTDAIVEDDVTILDRSVVVRSTISSGAHIGPFAHIRPDSTVGAGAHVGNFVELKKTTLGPGSKANHLAYLGDATIGRDVNVGAGTITCNYDGVNKHQTIIEDGVFIGSDSQLIAPVTVGKGAYVAAGSSITEDVPPDALAIARGRQDVKPGWAAKRRAAMPPKPKQTKA
jgi:bifunctional UDP-N-acetylglucosamine pyrophosphorylase/glucosamine-1-phosphate N-acetyltransferase